MAGSWSLGLKVRVAKGDDVVEPSASPMASVQSQMLQCLKAGESWMHGTERRRKIEVREFNGWLGSKSWHEYTYICCRASPLLSVQMSFTVYESLRVKQEQREAVPSSSGDFTASSN